MLLRFENVIFDTERVVALLEDVEVKKSGTTYTTKIYFTHPNRNGICYSKGYSTINKIAEAIGWKDINNLIL